MILRLGLALYVACCASLAAAQPLRTVIVHVPGCADANELLELLRLELQADAIALTLARDLEQTRERESLSLVQSCGAARTHAGLHYRDRQAKETAREVSLSGVERSLQPRVIALALAELLRSSADEPAPGPPRPEEPDTEAAPSPEPAAEEAAEPAEAAERAPVQPERVTTRVSAIEPPVRRVRRDAWALAVGPSFEVVFGQPTLSVGATAALEWQRLSIGVLGAIGSSRDDLLGTASYQRLHAFVGYAVLRAESGAFGFDVGPRVAAGATLASATPTEAATADDSIDATSSVSVELATTLRFSASWLARLRTEFGYALGPRFQADARTLADFGGAYLGGSLSIGLALAPAR